MGDYRSGQNGGFPDAKNTLCGDIRQETF